jgi:uncharacterized flavoprotein (TIGR03862 family)
MELAKQRYTDQHVVIIGAGPAGLFAAEILGLAGVRVTIYEQMKTPARKFLMAGRGGLNITHSENLTDFIARYGVDSKYLMPLIEAYTPTMLREWCHGLGEETFVGSSGRVFPKSFKASPLLRAWQARLASYGVALKTAHRWLGFDELGRVQVEDDKGQIFFPEYDAMIFATGGASWPRLGSDGAGIEYWTARGVKTVPLRAANCGFIANWSPYFRENFAGKPLKSISVRVGDFKARGEIMINQAGFEGGAIYAVARALRTAWEVEGRAILHIDLKPDMTVDDLRARLKAGRPRDSLGNIFRKQCGLTPQAVALLHEVFDKKDFAKIEDWAVAIKDVPVAIDGTFSLERAISSAGGIAWEAVDGDLMLQQFPQHYVAGEMLEWEAPTGGYLLQACFAMGYHVAHAILRRFEKL